MANGVLAGLFGGASPYPVDPQMQQGLLGNAGRQAGIALLANAMNPNIGQGLAAALAAGQQAYQGGAQQAYQVGRQEEQDEAMRQYREAQTTRWKALAGAEESEREAAISAAKEVARMRGLLREKDPRAEFLGADQVRELYGRMVEEGMFPEEPEAKRQYDPNRGVIVDVTEGTFDPVAGLPPKQYKPAAGARDAEPEALSPSRLSTRLGQLIDGLTEQYENRINPDGTVPPMPPYHVIRSQAEQMLAQEVAAVGRASGQPAPAPQTGSPPGGGGAPPKIDAAMTKAIVDNLVATRVDLKDAIEAARGQDVSDAEILETLRSRGVL